MVARKDASTTLWSAQDKKRCRCGVNGQTFDHPLHLLVLLVMLVLVVLNDIIEVLPQLGCSASRLLL